MNKELEKIIASYLIVLVITIPFCMSAVFAESYINVKSASGEDGIGTSYKAIRKFYDITTIDFDVQITGDTEISQNQVKVNGFYPESCTPKAEGVSNCQYVEEGYFESKRVTILLSNDAGTTINSKMVEIITDKEPPTVETLNINPKFSNGEGITLDYSIEDYAEAGYSGGCVGIKDITFYEEDITGKVIEKISVPNPMECTYSGSYEYPTVSKSGEYRVCAIAVDYFDQESVIKCAEFTVDKDPPRLESVIILSPETDSEMYYFNFKELPVIVQAKIKGADLERSSISADLGSLHEYEEYAGMTPNNVYEDDGYTYAEWKITLQLKSTTSPQIIVNGNDLAGNLITPGQKNANQLKFDADGPVFTNLRTATGQINGQWWAGSETTFIADIDENPNNLEKKEVLLDLTDFGLGMVKPTNCTGSYTCTWHVGFRDNLHGSTGTVKTSLDSYDDIGNKADASISIELNVDTKAPQVDYIEITPIHNNIVSSDVDEIIVGDKLQIEAEVYEDTALSAYLDISTITGIDYEIPAVCTNINMDTWMCTWASTPEIAGRHPFDTTIGIRFVDFLGNEYIAEPVIKGTGIIDEENPDYWDIGKITCSPSMIDRQVTSLIERRLYCHVQLEPKFQDIELLDVGFDKRNCGSGDDSFDYVRSIDLLNVHAGSTDPYFKITLKTADMEIDELNFDCPISISTKVYLSDGPYMLANPEYDNASVKVPFYNMPLEDFSKEVENQIEDIKDGALVKLTWLSSLEKILKFAETLCGLIYTWNGIISTLNAIGVMIDKIANVPWLAWLKGIAQEWRFGVEAGDKIKEGVTGNMYKFCMFVSCDITIWGSWYNGYIENMHEIQVTGDRGSIFDWTGTNKIDIMSNTPEWMQGYGYDDISMWPENPRDSLVLSLAVGCIPGIIDGLQKLRQIDCNYGVCLRDSPDLGVSLKACKDQQKYLQCKFVWGEIFQIVPFAHFFKAIGQKLYTFLSDPFATAFGISNLYCEQFVLNADTHNFCVTFKVIREITKVLRNLESMINFVKSISQQAGTMDACADLLGELDDEEDSWMDA